MTPRTPRVTALEIIRVLEKRGFTLARSRGSHRIYKNEQGVRVTVSFHTGEVLHPKILRRILHDMDITEDDLRKDLAS